MDLFFLLFIYKISEYNENYQLSDIAKKEYITEYIVFYCEWNHKFFICAKFDLFVNVLLDNYTDGQNMQIVYYILILIDFFLTAVIVLVIHLIFIDIEFANEY